MPGLYEEADKMVRTKMMLSFNEPSRLDMTKPFPPWRFVKAANYYRHLHALQARATNEEEAIGIKDDYEALYQPMFSTDIASTEAFKEYRKKGQYYSRQCAHTTAIGHHP